MLNLIYDLDVHDDTVHTWDVWLTVDGGSADIAPYAVHGRISGSGLVEELPWDGRIYAEDVLRQYSFLPYFKSFTDEVTVAFVPKRDEGAEDSLRPLDFMAYFRGFTDKALVTDIVLGPLSHKDDLTIEAEVTQTAFTNGTVITPSILCARKITAVASPETKFSVSFDNGETWAAWLEGVWVQNGRMDVNELAAVPTPAWSGSVRIKAVMGKNDTLSNIMIYGGALALSLIHI